VDEEVVPEDDRPEASVEITQQDIKFLKSLKISFDEDL
jgi:hypothetical protein